jgi:PAS domain S-box-containing protein
MTKENQSKTKSETDVKMSGSTSKETFCTKHFSFDDLFNTSLDLLCIANIQGNFVKVNQEWENVLGYSPNELENKPFISFVHPNDVESTLEALKTLEGQGHILNFTNRYRCKDGTYRFFEWRSKPLGEIIFASVRDITAQKLGEEALRVSEEKYRSLFENAQEGFFQTTIDGRYISVNPALSRMYGYNSPEEFIESRKNISKDSYKDSTVRDQFLNKMLTYGFVKGFEYEVKKKDGSIIWFYEDARTVKDFNGEIKYFEGFVLDITDRKLAEQALKESEQTFRALFEKGPIGVAYHKMIYNDEGKPIDYLFLSANSSYLELTGVNPAGKLVTEAFPGIENDPFDWIGTFGKVAKTGVEIRFQQYLEHNKRWYDCVGYQYKPDHFVAAFLEITNQKKAEAALKENEEKLSTLFESMTEMVVLHDIVFDQAGRPINYRITDCNAAYTKITGIPRNAAIGRLANEVYGTEDPPYLEEFTRVGVTGEPFHYETYFAPMEKHFSISVVSPGKNKFATITTDITSAKQIQAIIAAKNKELEQIVYVASHDLRSPLVNVDGYSRELEFSIAEIKNVLEKHTGNPDEIERVLDTELPEMREALKHIRISTHQMDMLLKGLLKLSRTGRAALNLDAIDMNRLLTQIAATFEFQVKEIGGDIRFGELPPCKADSVQVTQIFTNLLANALKYSDPNRKVIIKISGSIKGNYSVYCVEDNGIGIAPEHQEKIFELFHRLNPSKTEGEGLGLTIVRQLLSRLEGDIRVESVLGQGSKFFVSLPIAIAKAKK